MVRLVTWTRTPVGLVPTQIDYSDYREVAGVKHPFKGDRQPYAMRMSIELSDVQPNVTIDRNILSGPPRWHPRRSEFRRSTKESICVAWQCSSESWTLPETDLPTFHRRVDRMHLLFVSIIRRCAR